MHLRGLNLNLLVALDALLSEGSVTAAGRKLHLSQSTMSCALGRLRRHLGDPLLVPLGRSMVLTDVARELAAPLRTILLQIETTFRERDRFDPGTSTRHFRIAASDYAVNLLLLDVRRQFDSIAPHIALEILPVVAGSVLALERGEIDLLILPDRYRIESCPEQVLFEDRLVCIASLDEATFSDQLSLEQFRAADHVIFQPDPGHIIAFDVWLREHYHFEPTVKLYMPNYSLLPMAVIGTRRLATIPERLARLYCTMLPIRIIEPAFPMPPVIEVLQWHPSRAADPGLAWLRALLGQAAGDVMTRGSTASRPRTRDSALRIRSGASRLPT